MTRDWVHDLLSKFRPAFKVTCFPQTDLLHAMNNTDLMPFANNAYIVVASNLPLAPIHTVYEHVFCKCIYRLLAHFV